MIHIITINWTTDKWIDIQADSFKKFIKTPYKVYTKLGNMGDDMFKKHSHKFHYCAPGKENEKSHVTVGMKLSIDEIKKECKPDDIIMIIDSDAFLIDNLDRLTELFKKTSFISVHEPEHEIDTNRLIPHPMFFMFKAESLSVKKEFSLFGISCCKDLEFVLTNILDDGTGTWWGGLLSYMSQNKLTYSAVRRTNKINLHPLYFGIYDDIIYHHWAGSRKMITRPDKRLHEQTGKSLESIAEENHKLSNKVYNDIINHKNHIIEYLKGNPTMMKRIYSQIKFE